jgi:hypothetical protein
MAFGGFAPEIRPFDNKEGRHAGVPEGDQTVRFESETRWNKAGIRA